MKKIIFLLSASISVASVWAQPQLRIGDPKLTEQWIPEPAVITPGKTAQDPPSDAIILFRGNDASAFEAKGGGAVQWKIDDGALTVVKGAGEIHTRQGFGDCQLHIEWRTPAEVKSEKKN